MILKELLPDIPNLLYSSCQIDKVSKSIFIELTLISTESACPCCGNISDHHHSNYQRKVTDLSWGELSVTLLLNSNKFFCRYEECPQKVFCERLGRAIKKYARKTSRLLERLKVIALSVGCNPGSRLLSKMSYVVSSSTLLKMLHGIKTEKHKVPKILGVDDWAYRKGGIYGTILVDLEERRPIDLLPDRTASTLKKWLLAHPGVKIVSRDRSGAYAEGTRQGAPKVIQIADRWHLLKNLKEALQKLIEKSSKEVRETSWYFEGIEKQKNLVVEMEQKKRKMGCQEKKSSMQTRYSLIFSEVKKLHAQGLGKKTIARKLCMSRNTVKRYLRYEEYPGKSLPEVKANSARMHYQRIRELWENGEKSVKKIWDILTADGHDVSRPSVYYVTTKFKETKTRVSLMPVINWNARKLSGLLLQYQNEMKANEYRYIKKLCQIQPKIGNARKLSLGFRSMLAKRKGERLRTWIKSCKESGIIELSSYARTIKRDYAAVKAAATYDWSNGQVEGQVNRLKNIKRQMYGRAGFELLKIRVLDSS